MELIIILGIVALLIMISVARLLFVPSRLGGMEDRIKGHALLAAEEIANRIHDVGKNIEELRGQMNQLDSKIDNIDRELKRLRG